MFDIIGKRFWYFLISGLILLAAVILLSTAGLKSGIDFSGGSMMTVNFEKEVTQAELKQELSSLGYPNVIIQTTGDGDFIIRMQELSRDDRAGLETALSARFGEFESESDSISALIGGETTDSAAKAVAVAAIGILLYVTWAFRRMPKPFHYGVCAIVALVHDALVALGVFSFLGAVMDWEINLGFIIGILAVIGYSVNNTVVVFDRIRENLAKGISPSFEVIVNSSMIESIGRSLNTSMTTLFVVVALLLFVGVSIQNFAVVLLVGIIAGTFSSLCIAPSLLVVWERREWGRFIQWLPLRTQAVRGD